jgi:hypothetical protein
MKLFIVTFLKEYLADVSKIFKQANIDVFSTCDIIGHRDGQPTILLEDWFASGDEQFNSLMIFTFTVEANAIRGMELIEIYNQNVMAKFPVRAFLVPVEKSL